MKNIKTFLIIALLVAFISSENAFSVELINGPNMDFIQKLINQIQPNNENLIKARRGGGGRRGGSFGGSRRSRSTSKSSKSTKSRSSTAKKTDPKKTPSFGGKRMTQTEARKTYGTPRKTETMTGKNAAGERVSYNVNSYGGYGSGLMTGYMMGATPFMWSMPFHPAFYYSRPTYVTNPNGTIDVYPPRFSFGKLLITLIIITAIIFIIRRIIKARRASGGSQSSFG
jgi:hypothetical protein